MSPEQEPDSDEWPDPGFYGICTCGHDEEKHGWGGCGVEDADGNECPCPAGWEE